MFHRHFFSSPAFEAHLRHRRDRDDGRLPLTKLVLFEKTHMHHDRRESRVRLPRASGPLMPPQRKKQRPASPSSARFL